MIRFLCLIAAVVFSQSASAEFVGTDLMSDDNEVVIEPEIVDNVALEEPIFSSRKSERNIAAADVETTPSNREFQGQLRVVKEIPYSYAWVSHQTMQMRVLAEIEAEEAKKK